MTGLIDYAGLFPPSKLDMAEAVNHYARDLRSELAAMLGRFICPVGRLEELSRHAAMLMPGTHATSGYREHADDIAPWAISAIIDGELEPCLDRIDDFNEHHTGEENGLARIDAIELRAQNSSFIDTALDMIPDDILPFFEMPLEADYRGMVAALAGDSAAAKVRCGGITADLIPSSADIAGFIHACAAAGVAMKATAGLHHPIRAEHPLTYEPDAPRAVMHGFVNVFLGAAIARTLRGDVETITRVLDETDPSAFSFTDDAARWRNTTIETAQLAHARESFALSYGSCSFDEPIADMKTLGWL